MNGRRDLVSLTTATALALGLTLPAFAASILPTGFTGAGVGQGKGTITDDGKTLTIKASGADIAGGGSDSFYFVSMPMTGDGTITARLTGATGGVSGSGQLDSEKVGVMVREKPDADSLEAQLVESNSNFGLTLSWEDTLGTAIDQNTARTGYAPRRFPIWLRMQRSGTTFTGFYSWDGQIWIPTDSQTISMGSSANIGLAIASHDDGTTMTTTWDNVSVTPSQAQVTGLHACGNDKGVVLTWNAVTGAKGYNVFRGTPGVDLNSAKMEQLMQISTSAVTAATFTDTDASIQSGTRQVYAVSAVMNDGTQTPLSAALGGKAGTPPSPLSGFTFTVFGNHQEGDCTGGASVGAFLDPTTNDITLRGQGTDLWSDHEDFVFLSQKVTGHSRMTAQILDFPLGISSCCSKAGVMIRDGLAPDARYVMATLRTDGLRQQRRTVSDPTSLDDNEAGDSLDASGSRDAINGAGLWLQVERQGDNVWTRYSIDGKTFMPISSGDDPFTGESGLPADLQIGLVLAGRDRDAVIQNRMSEVQFKIISVEQNLP